MSVSGARLATSLPFISPAVTAQIEHKDRPMLEVDLHAHSHFSLCGNHSVLEMLQRAGDNGMLGLAITDHGPALNGRLNSTFFDRLHDPIPGIRLLKGVEANILDKKANTDFPGKFLPFCDIVLAGIHEQCLSGVAEREYTDLLIKTMNVNPYVDIITHPDNYGQYIDYQKLAAAARDRGVALELNNSKTALKRLPAERTRALITACKETGCRMVVCSDAHAVNEVGDDRAVAPLLQQAEFPEELLITAHAQSVFDFIRERRVSKLQAQR
ncbi:MAG: PHP domain-containing protein [Chitinivibrionales bacterium]|nr:PHP domain-containing protein [Chitinivibrionales bacterium]